MSATARALRILFLLSILASLVALGAAPVAATHPGSSGTLAVACEDGLYTVDADGTDWALLSAGEFLNPSWSPGGKFIAFSRRASNTTVSLWTMNADGSGKHRHTFTQGSDLDPEWTADGTKILFASDKEVFGPDGFIIWGLRPSFESSPLQVNNDHAYEPAAAPDNVRIAYVLKRTGEPQAVWISEEFVETNVVMPPPGAADEAPDWAPTGDRYLFVRVEGGVRSVWAVDTDGSDLHRLTDESLDVLSPRWSPDGSTIAFLARPAGDAGTDAYGLWTMEADGQNQDEVLGDLACSHVTWQPIPVFPLVDAKFTPFRAEIEWLYNAGITGGCSAERFCPWNGVSREQMASFLARALDLPPAVADHFTDDEDSIHEENINRIADAGITGGCGDGTRFCPGSRISREQMASFLARALDLPPAVADHFTDDEDSIHEANINRLAEASITGGCAADRFCPTHTVQRQQMAAFLYRALAED
ncbi:MAG TPA: S-layer homology domain-containing protein [Candidatus Limnocylindria bacterium]|nr:S-layer homology domain-containing protein [Candidatus Limnocylindria bacterium]